MTVIEWDHAQRGPSTAAESPTPGVTELPATGTSPTESGAELIQQVALGDREAFAAAYDLFAPAVHGVALRVLRDPSLAEEVTQDVFLTVWQKAASFDPSRGSVRTWALTFTHRRAVDVVRREQSLRDRTARSAALGSRHVFDEVADEVLERDATESAGRQVDLALASLTPLQRRTITMAYFDGLTYAQVAEQLSIPLSTAKTRIRDGLRRMARELGEPVSAAS